MISANHDKVEGFCESWNPYTSFQCWGAGAGSRDFLQGAGVFKPYLVGARAGAGSQAPGLVRAGAGKRNLLKRLQGAGSQAFLEGGGAGEKSTGSPTLALIIHLL